MVTAEPIVLIAGNDVVAGTGGHPSYVRAHARAARRAGFAMGTHLAIPFLGLALVDNVNPEALARVCREEGRYEFLFSATPLRLRGATGAPAHPIAIF